MSNLDIGRRVSMLVRTYGLHVGLAYNEFSKNYDKQVELDIFNPAKYNAQIYKKMKIFRSYIINNNEILKKKYLN